MADLVAPTSFAFTPQKPGSQASATSQIAPISMTNNAAGAAFNAAPGGDFRADTSTFDQLVKMGGKLLEAPIKRMQDDLFWQGFNRASQGEALSKLASERPAWANVFGTDAVAEGARLYSVQNASSQFQKTLITDMPRLRALSPDDYTSEVRKRFEAQYTGDAQADAVYQQEFIKFMPVQQEMYIRSNAAYKQEEAAKVFSKSIVDKSDLFDAMSKSFANGEIDQRTFDLQKANYVASLAPLDGMNPDTYEASFASSVAMAASKGSVHAVQAIRDSGALDLLRPEAKLQIYSQMDAAKSKATSDYTRDNYAALAEFQTKKALGSHMGGYSSPEEEIAAMEQINSSYRNFTGVNDHNLIDIGATLVSANLKFGQKAQILREQKIQQDLAPGIAAISVGIRTGKMSAAEGAEAARVVNERNVAGGADPTKQLLNPMETATSAATAEYTVQKQIEEHQAVEQRKQYDLLVKKQQRASDIQTYGQDFMLGAGAAAGDNIRDPDGSRRALDDADKDDAFNAAFINLVQNKSPEEGYRMVGANVNSPRGSYVSKTLKNSIQATMQNYVPPDEVDSKASWNEQFDAKVLHPFSVMRKNGGEAAAAEYYGDYYPKMLEYSQSVSRGDNPISAFRRVFYGSKPASLGEANDDMMRSYITSYVGQSSISPGWVGTTMGKSGIGVISNEASKIAIQMQKTSPGSDPKTLYEAAVQKARSQGLRIVDGYAWKGMPGNMDVVQAVGKINGGISPANEVGKAMHEILKRKFLNRGIEVSDDSLRNNIEIYETGPTSDSGLTKMTVIYRGQPAVGGNGLPLEYAEEITTQDIADMTLREGTSPRARAYAAAAVRQVGATVGIAESVMGVFAFGKDGLSNVAGAVNQKVEADKKAANILIDPQLVPELNTPMARKARGLPPLPPK